MSTKSMLRGVVFDMDGTLTVPVIDFTAMYKAVLGEEEYKAMRAKNPTGIDILHHIETWSTPKQQKAYEIITEFERQGMERLQIMPGAVELCEFLDSRNIRRGLITRNIKAAVDLFHRRFGLEFTPAHSREFRPYKPDPTPLLHICTTWDVQPNEVIMIGDSLKDDVACGKRAGAFTCLLDETGRYNSYDFLAADLQPDFKHTGLLPAAKDLLERMKNKHLNMDVRLPWVGFWGNCNPTLKQGKAKDLLERMKNKHLNMDVRLPWVGFWGNCNLTLKQGKSIQRNRFFCSSFDENIFY